MVDTTQPKVEIFTGPNCSYCLRAKALLKDKGVEFEELNVALIDNRTAMSLRLPRARTIPQIFIDGEHIGGCDDLEQLNASGRLNHMLNKGKM